MSKPQLPRSTPGLIRADFDDMDTVARRRVGAGTGVTWQAPGDATGIQGDRVYYEKSGTVVSGSGVAVNWSSATVRNLVGSSISLSGANVVVVEGVYGVTAWTHFEDNTTGDLRRADLTDDFSAWVLGCDRAPQAGGFTTRVDFASGGVYIPAGNLYYENRQDSGSTLSFTSHLILVRLS